MIPIKVYMNIQQGILIELISLIKQHQLGFKYLVNLLFSLQQLVNLICQVIGVIGVIFHQIMGKISYMRK